MDGELVGRLEGDVVSSFEGTMDGKPVGGLEGDVVGGFKGAMEGALVGGGEGGLQPSFTPQPLSSSDTPMVKLAFPNVAAPKNPGILDE